MVNKVEGEEKWRCGGDGDTSLSNSEETNRIC